MNVNDLTYSINGAIFEVSRTLGFGFLEKVYENALLVELHKRGLRAESQVPIKVRYKGEIVGEYFADILVEGKIIIELKAVENLEKIHEETSGIQKHSFDELCSIWKNKYPKWRSGQP